MGLCRDISLLILQICRPDGTLNELHRSKNLEKEEYIEDSCLAQSERIRYIATEIQNGRNDDQAPKIKVVRLVRKNIYPV